MTDPSLGPDDSLSAAAIAAAVGAVRPDWHLVDAEPMPEGSDHVYGVAVADGDGAEHRAVLKCFRSAEALAARTPERFLVEVDLLGLVGRETDLPVPEVFGASESHEGGPAPAFLMEPMPGDPARGLAVGDDEVADRLLAESGRYLARIHDLRSFEQFGDLVAGAGRPIGSPDDPSEPAAADGRDAWSDRLREIADAALDGLDDRFADLEAPLREYVDDRLAALDLTAESALLHGDYRPGNLLADPETGEVTAVLDWGAAQAGDPRYELAWAVREFAGRAPVGSPARERVREALFEAYEAERCTAFERGPGFERRQSFYLAVSWVAELGWFDVWWGGAEGSAREERAAQLRENVESLR